MERRVNIYIVAELLDTPGPDSWQQAIRGGFTNRNKAHKAARKYRSLHPDKVVGVIKNNAEVVYRLYRTQPIHLTVVEQVHATRRR